MNAPISRAEILQRKANVVRSRLLRAIDELDERRQRIVHVGHEAEHVAKQAVLPIVALAALGIGFGVVRAVARARRPKPLLPLRIGFREPRESFAVTLLKRTAMSAATVIASALAKRYARPLIEGRPVS